MSRAIAFNHFLIYQNALFPSANNFSASSYGHTDSTQFGDIMQFSSKDIIQNGDRAIGVLLSNVSVGGYVVYLEEWSSSRYLERRNGQLFASIEAEYFPFNISLREDRRSFGIQVSDMLIDPDSPLRYGIQNAFDDNPATAFVANSESGLFEIIVHNAYLPSSITKLAIINGFTRNPVSYRNNNRIKSVSIYGLSDMQSNVFELNDNIFSWQIIESFNYGFAATSVYKGERYNKTGISGFNIYLEDSGWLFGDINE
jgi:hypothetical protein